MQRYVKGTRASTDRCLEVLDSSIEVRPCPADVDVRPSHILDSHAISVRSTTLRMLQYQLTNLLSPLEATGDNRECPTLRR